MLLQIFRIFKKIIENSLIDRIIVLAVRVNVSLFIKLIKNHFLYCIGVLVYVVIF